MGENSISRGREEIVQTGRSIQIFQIIIKIQLNLLKSDVNFHLFYLMCLIKYFSGIYVIRKIFFRMNLSKEFNILK